MKTKKVLFPLLFVCAAVVLLCTVPHFLPEARAADTSATALENVIFWGLDSIGLRENHSILMDKKTGEIWGYSIGALKGLENPVYLGTLSKLGQRASSQRR